MSPAGNFACCSYQLWKEVFTSLQQAFVFQRREVSWPAATGERSIY